MRHVSLFALGLFLTILVTPQISFSDDEDLFESMSIVEIDAATPEDRTDIASLGIAIEEVYDDYVVGIAFPDQLSRLEEMGFTFETTPIPSFIEDFPPADSEFHNLEELHKALFDLEDQFSNIMSIVEIGKSVNDNPLYMIRISGPDSQGVDLPGIIFLGTHHAREHLSTEVPLYLIKHLVENYGKSEKITELVNSREIWIMPMVNPDGSDYDVEGSNPYKWWRKNRRAEEASKEVYGVDLNRNYGFKWGGQGAGTQKNSETYRGPSAFSEPETQAVRDFVKGHDNITILLSYHTFSELILYPWGYTYDSLENEEDLRVHDVLARTMGDMTGYRPQQSSELYITSGDTTDWSYGELGIISFTFELFPSSLMQGGFYPSASNIQAVVKNNIQPALYLIDLADNPHRVIETDFRPLMSAKLAWPPAY